MSKEIYKRIEGFGGRYYVSNKGNVESKYSGKRKKLTLCNDGKGYKAVMLWYGDKRKYIRVHRLVAQVFIPNPYMYNTVNHINGKRDDNRVENLEWVTPYLNSKHCRILSKKGRMYESFLATVKYLIKTKTVEEVSEFLNIPVSYVNQLLGVENG